MQGGLIDSAQLAAVTLASTAVGHNSKKKCSGWPAAPRFRSAKYSFPTLALSLPRAAAAEEPNESRRVCFCFGTFCRRTFGASDVAALVAAAKPSPSHRAAAKPPRKSPSPLIFPILPNPNSGRP